MGQFYCGKTGRGWVTLGFWLLGLLFAFSTRAGLKGTGIMVISVLWIFSFPDAYFTAIEINRGQDTQLDGQNSRVAVTLNLLTAGFGYFYLGERRKGTVIFVATQVLRFGVPHLTGYVGGVVSLALVVVQMLMGADAYRIGRKQLKEALGPQPEQTAAATAKESRMPWFIPIALVGLAATCFLGFIIFSLALAAVRSPQVRRAAARAKSQDVPSGAQRGSGNTSARQVARGPVTDLLSAVQEVQWLEKQGERSKDDIPNLKRDVQIFDAVLNGKKVDDADGAVAHFYRAEGLRLINSVHEHEGETVESSAAKRAIEDFNKVIAGGVNTYIPAVNVANAEYFAGSVVRNYLRSDSMAYKYWEKCAREGHAGCLRVIAVARLTGDGGQKVDLSEAVALHTIVFNSGVRYRCAGAQSARRSGDDELEWVNKSYGLMDKLKAAEDNRNVCQRSEAEIEEFLLQMSRGQREVSILQDAAGRLGDESPTARAVIQLFSGSTNDTEFEAVVQSSKSEGGRCSVYFDAMWYAEIMKDDAAAQRYHRHLSEIGKFHCGTELEFASRFKP